MDTKNYSLEKHLEAICKEDNDYNLLLSAWRLNKDSLNGALKTIALNFPNYSMHDISHSITLLDNIQRLLGRDRVERLGATDTFLILMAALTHDIGMYMSYEFLEKEWKKPEMEDLLKEYAKHSDKKIADAARKLLGHRSCQDDTAKGFQWALELRDAVTTIIAHQMRGGHEDRSKSYLEKKDDKFAKMANSFHCDAFPSRFLSLLADVAHLHGTNFDEVLKLNHKADGLRGDMVHPRFIACMIRLGDLLDVDSNRFNPFSLATLKDLPESSEAHYDKHNAVKHLLISPDGIEAELDCPTDASYRIARELFDMLQKEVEKQSQNWNRIAPQDLGGLPPVLNQDNIIINFKGSKTKSELRNLRFDISGKRTFEMLKGGAMYQNPGRAFIREILQNALDATKLQVWKDIDFFLPFKIEKTNKEISSVDGIKFSSDIPASVYEKYPISLTVEYDEKRQVVRVICEDSGTGISEESLIRMTSQVGASRKADKNYSDIVKQMPYFLQPTAAFGLGLQTVFYVTDEFTVETHYPGEPTRRIVFRSSVDGSYCSIEDEDFRFERSTKETDKNQPVAHGTTVTIEIGKEHFGELFEISENQIQEMDKDHNSFSYYIPIRIDSYVDFCFHCLELVPISYKSQFLSKRIGTYNEINNFEFLSEESHYRVYRYGDVSRPHFYIEENKYGSLIDVVYPIRFEYNPDYLYLRGVNISDRYHYKFSSDSMRMNWNIVNREADQLVSISRDCLLPKGIKWCSEAMKTLYPDIIRLTFEKLYNEYKGCVNNEVKQKLHKQLLYICIEKWRRSELIDIDAEFLDIKLDKKMFWDNEGNEITASNLFSASILISGSYYYESDTPFLLIDESLKRKDCIYIGAQWLIPDDYSCRVVYVDNSDIICYQFERKEGSNPEFVEMKGDWKAYYGEISHIECIHGFKEYKKIVVCGDAPLLGRYNPSNSNCWIYSFGHVPNGDIELGKEKMNEKLRNGGIKELVPTYIVELIQKYNVLKNDRLTADEIYDEYIRMILDFTFGADKKRKRVRKKRLSEK